MRARSTRASGDSGHRAWRCRDGGTGDARWRARFYRKARRCRSLNRHRQPRHESAAPGLGESRASCRPRRQGRHRGRMLGNAPAMAQLRADITNLADTGANVLIRGDTGTGKELVARCLHDYGNRRDGHFVAVNCGAMPESMLESELFGHESGAFTGATKRRSVNSSTPAAGRCSSTKSRAFRSPCR